MTVKAETPDWFEHFVDLAHQCRVAGLGHRRGLVFGTIHRRTLVARELDPASIRSKVVCVIARSRSSALRIFMVGVLGRSSTMSTYRGSMNRAIRASRNSTSSLGSR